MSGPTLDDLLQQERGLPLTPTQQKVLVEVLGMAGHYGAWVSNAESLRNFKGFSEAEKRHLPVNQMQRKLKSLYKRDLEDLVTRCGAPAWKCTKDDLARIIVDFLLSFDGDGYYPTMLNRTDKDPLFVNSNWEAEAASQHLTLHMVPLEGQRRMNFRLSHVIGVDEVDRLLPELEPLKSLDPRFQAFDAPLGKPRFLCQTFNEWRKGALRIHFATPETLQFRRPKNLRVHLRFLRVENYRGGIRTTSFCPKNWSFDVNSLTVFLPKDQLHADRCLSFQAEYFLDLTPFLKKKRGSSHAMNTVEIKGIDYSRLRQNALHCVLAQTVTVKDREDLVRMVRTSTVEYFEAYKPPDEKGVVRLDELQEERGQDRVTAARQQTTRILPLEKARRKELTKFSAGPDDIKVDSISFSMKCPLSQGRIDIPVKGRECNHVQCFNLETYLTMETTRKSDECPVCNQKTASIQQLYICPLNEEALKEFPHADEVELHPDGKLSLPTPQTSVDNGQVAQEIDLESDQPLSSVGARSFTTPAWTPRSVKRRKSVVTIDLTDNDDDEVPVTPRISPHLSATFNRLNRDRMRLQLLQSMGREGSVETATIPLNSGEEASQSRVGNLGTCGESTETPSTPAASRVLPSSVTGGSRPRTRARAPVDIEPPDVLMEIDPAEMSFDIDPDEPSAENSAQRESSEPAGSEPTESDFEKAIAEVFGDLKEPEEIMRDREHEKSVSKKPTASLPFSEEVGESVVEKSVSEPSEVKEAEPLPAEEEAEEPSFVMERETYVPEKETEEPSSERQPEMSNETNTDRRSVDNETGEPSLEGEPETSKEKLVDNETEEPSLEREPETSNEKDTGGRSVDHETDQPSLEREPEIPKEKDGSSIEKEAEGSSPPEGTRVERSQHESVVSPDEQAQADMLGMQMNEKSIGQAMTETIVDGQPPTPAVYSEDETLMPREVPIDSSGDSKQEAVKHGPSEVSAEVSSDRETDRTCSQLTPTNNSAS